MKTKKTGPVRTIVHILEAVLVIALGTIFSRLPKAITRRVCLVGGAFLYRFDKRDRRLAYHNLDIIIKEPPLPQFKKDQIVKALFVNIVTGAVEYLRLDDIEPQNFLEFVRIDNYEAIHTALEKRKGVLAICAHLGNWEYLGTVSAKLGYHVGTILKRQHNPYTDRWLTRIREEKGGVKCFYHGIGLNHRIGVHLKQNGILALLADQRQIVKPLIIPFFGVPSATTDGPAKLHLWYEAPIVFAFSIQQADGKYLLQFDGPYDFAGSGDYKKDCVKIMTFINQKYETLIRKYPEQWLSLLTPRWQIP